MDYALNQKMFDPITIIGAVSISFLSLYVLFLAYIVCRKLSQRSPYQGI